MSKLCAISVDLDEICHYQQIHGLAPVTTAPGLVYSTALERLHAWAKAESLPLTWFVVGEQLDDQAACDRLEKLAQAGDELGNHTEHHYYDLTCRGREAMRQEILDCRDRLQRLTGHVSFGFRAPGYLMTDELAELLHETNALYDSSVFPCPSYYAAKATVLAGQRLLGRRSRSLMDHPRVLFAPTTPYRQGSHYWQEGAGLRELPITVSPWLRLPYIGTQLTLLGPRLCRVLSRAVSSLNFVNLELHGIDALDAGDGLANLATMQPDLRIPWERKLTTLSVAVQTLKRAGFSFTTLNRCFVEA